MAIYFDNIKNTKQPKYFENYSKYMMSEVDKIIVTVDI